MKRLFGLAIALAIGAQSAYAAMLISPEEVDLPAYQGGEGIRLRSAPGGPSIEVVAPNIAASTKPTVRRPVAINVRFGSQDGASVDMRSLKVTYLRLFGIDITDRLRPYVQGSEIKVDEADIPEGDHSIRVEIRDNQGRASTQTFSFVITK